MFRTLVLKELIAILKSPKFAVTFAACAILIVLGVFIGIQDYLADARQVAAGRQLEREAIEGQASWALFTTKVFRDPDPLQIVSSGVTNDIGRYAAFEASSAVQLTHSAYSDDPAFAIFRFIDLNFIFLVALSLFAILFTYDAVCGEREAGTLRLVFANAVPRGTYILAKLAGSWLALIVPVLIPLLIGVLLIVVFGVPLTGGDWARLAAFLAVSLLYVTFFIAFGIFVSAAARRPAVSFLVLLVSWVAMTLIVPRIAVMASGRIVPVPSAAEVDARVEAYSKDRWQRFVEHLTEVSKKRSEAMSSMSAEEREAYMEENEWSWMEEDDAERKKLAADIKEHSRRLFEELENASREQERLAFTLSRVSPASAYQLASMSLAGTDVGLKGRSVSAMENYHTLVYEYAEKKSKEEGPGAAGIRITFDPDKGFSVSAPRERKNLDTSDMPQFAPPLRAVSSVLAGAAVDAGLLALFAIGAFAGAFAVFLRYDVR